MQQDAAAVKALGGLVVDAGTWVYRNSTVNMLANPEDYAAAQQESKQAMGALAEKMNNMDARDWGNFTGQVGFEIGLNMATGGGAGIATGMKAADLTGDAMRAAQKLDKALEATRTVDKASDATRAVDKLEDVADADKAVDKAEHASDAAKTADKAEDVEDVEDVADAAGPEKLGDVVYGGDKAVEGSAKTSDELLSKQPEGAKAADSMKREAKFNAKGERVMSIRELKAFKKRMNDMGVKVEVDLKKKVLERNQVAGFDNQNGIIYLKKPPTMYQALHESHHAEQWKKLGVEAYNSQSRLQKEQYVYEQLMKNKEVLSSSEINHAKAYIRAVKNNGIWPPVDPSTGLYILN